MNKQKWLDAAEIMDAHRVIPKIITFTVMAMYAWFAYDSYTWVKTIVAESDTLPPAVAAFVGATLSALGGVLMLVINKYFGGGRDWSKNKDKPQD